VARRWRAPTIAILLVALIAIPSPAHPQSAPKRQRDSWLGADKVKHFFLSAFIESMTFSGLQAAGASRRAAFTGAIGTTAALAIGREVHDKKTKGLFSLGDLAWDAAGAGAAGLVLRKTQR
jgi:uncharacterized protein YfiM (DUF2279 family)